MNTKLTLRVDDSVVKKAKSQAGRRGKSVSQMFGEFVELLSTASSTSRVPPLTTALRGVLSGRNVSEGDYKEHLREKHL